MVPDAGSYGLESGRGSALPVALGCGKGKLGRVSLGRRVPGGRDVGRSALSWKVGEGSRRLERLGESNDHFEVS